MTRVETVLAGCRSVPLASYLKALGVLRLVAEQADAEARGRWTEEGFALTSRLDGDGLLELLLTRYRPTPILAPWNGGSGFFPKDQKSGIEALRASASERFSPYREAIGVAGEALAFLGLAERPADEEKRRLLTLLRGLLPEPALRWFDAAILLTEEKPRFPPLLGTGGNDGRLDFTNNFMQRLVELFDPETGAACGEAAAWLQAALFDLPVAGLPSIPIGQYDPAGAGGPNATTGFSGGPPSNPWDFVLMLEGAMAFAAAATRRGESVEGTALSFPFTVHPSGAGSGAVDLADEGAARAEIWLPLWRQPATYPEIRALLAEGRVTLDRRPAADGLEFARAVAALGVDRGIDAFERYGFLMRNGRSFLATPEGRMRVRWSPPARLLDELDHAGWWGRLRGAARGREAPALLRQAAKALEDAAFALTRDPSAVAVQDALIALGAAHGYLARSPKHQETIPPLPPLSRRWAREAADGGDEIQIATALAGLAGPAGPILGNLFPVVEEKGRRQWRAGSKDAVWGHGSLTANLTAVARRRLLRLRAEDLRGGAFEAEGGADEAAVAAFLAGGTDDRRIAALLAGLALVRPAGPVRRTGRSTGASYLPAGYALLKLLFLGPAAVAALGILDQGAALEPPPRLIDLLRAGRSDEAVDLAAQRLRVAGARVAPRGRVQTPAGDSQRLLAALVIPLADNAALPRAALPEGGRRREAVPAPSLEPLTEDPAS